MKKGMLFGLSPIEKKELKNEFATLSSFYLKKIAGTVH